MNTMAAKTSNFQQTVKTWGVASKAIAKKTWIDAFHLNKPTYEREMISFGAWTRQNLIELGPTYIKLGQIASARTDIFSEEFTRELSKLQDECPPIQDTDIVKIVEKELNVTSLDEVFLSFDKEPYKAASIGQVHCGVLKNGNKVVVKVQRPRIKEIVLDDLKTVRSISNLLSLFRISQEGDSDLFEQCEEYLMQEVDYEREANNAKLMRKNLFEDEQVIIPRVCTKLSTKSIMVMERVDGVKITEIKREKNKQQAIDTLVRCFVSQFLDYGVIHGDPHPGNVAYRKGDIILYDFGLVIDVSSVVRDSFDDVITSIIQKDAKRLTDILTKAKLIIPNSSKANITYFFDAVFNMAAKQMDGDFDFEESVELLEDLGYSDSTRPFTISNDLIYLAKSYTLVEGICKTLDPDYMPIETLRPYVESKITSSDISSNINFEGAMTDILEIPAKVRNINASILTIEKSTYSMTAKTKNLKEDVRNLQIIVGMFMFYILQH